MKIKKKDSSEAVTNKIILALEGKSYGFVESVAKNILTYLDLICVVSKDWSDAPELKKQARKS